MNADLLKPYRPGIDGPWTNVEAAHLLRRGGFRAPAGRIADAARKQGGAVVDEMLQAGIETDRFRELDSLGEALAARDDIAALAGWWLARMVHTASPLAARMALFWHNHFATSNAKIRSAAMMLAQLRTFERHALGSFDALLRAVARDPAMIVWLDGDSNNKGRPNENFARELMELFTLGVGSYAEKDIKEVARAFTGWHQRGGAFHFSRAEHDDGVKQVLGESGRFDGADVIPILLRQPAAATFLARKLLREFLTDAPDEASVAAFAEVLRTEQFHVGRALRVLLTSRAMLAPAAYRARISSPVEYIVGTARALEMRLDMTAAARAAGEMGQRLFEPPSVKGWPGGRVWIDSATMLVRMNAAAAACRQRDDGVGLDAAAMRERHGLATIEKTMEFLTDLLLDSRPPTALRGPLRDAMKSAKNGDEAMRVAVRLILSSPEYQLA